jgi:hypothetical protein
MQRRPESLSSKRSSVSLSGTARRRGDRRGDVEVPDDFEVHAPFDACAGDEKDGM